MSKKTTQLLAKTTKQFSKANKKFLESGKESKEAKTAMQFMETMCQDVAAGGRSTASTKLNNQKPANKVSKKCSSKGFFGIIMNLFWYLAIFYIFGGLTYDFSRANWHWKRTTTERSIVCDR